VHLDIDERDLEAIRLALLEDAPTTRSRRPRSTSSALGKDTVGPRAEPRDEPRAAAGTPSKGRRNSSSTRR
jgi:hypothetical protein